MASDRFSPEQCYRKEKRAGVMRMRLEHRSRNCRLDNTSLAITTAVRRRLGPSCAQTSALANALRR